MIRRFRSWLRKEVNNMAVIYVALIVKGKRTYDSVPDLIKPQVKEMLIDLFWNWQSSSLSKAHNAPTEIFVGA